MERTINNQYFIGMEVMNKEVNLTLHKIIATTNFLKMLEALQETNIESEAILTGLIACFNQQVITDKGIDKLFDDDHSGWCTNCGDWTHDFCEPDARKYEFPACNKKTCYGAEELLIENLFE